MDTSVRPGDDFFRYVNGTWADTTEMPADKSRYGLFDKLRDESQEHVKAIIEESASGDFAKGTDEQKVGDLYNSFLDWDVRDARGIEPLQPELDRIDAISDYDELAVYFAGATKRALDAPFGVGQLPDPKDPQRYAIVAGQSGLGLPDREYYLKDDEKSEEIRNQYVAHIAKMFDLAGLGDGAAAADTIMALETRIATEHMTKEQSRRYLENYNKVDLADLSALMPNFNWDGFLAELEISNVPFIGVFTMDYLKALLDTWKTYLTWSALNNAAGRLTRELDAQNFEFYGKVLSGTEEQREDWRRATNLVDGTVGEVVGKVYVKQHFPPEAKERMLELVGNLVRAYEKSIKELDWMTDTTKAEALDKLSKFHPMVGYPDKWRDYSALEIEADDLYGNIERAAMAEFRRQRDRHDGPVDKLEWGMNPPWRQTTRLTTVRSARSSATKSVMASTTAAARLTATACCVTGGQMKIVRRLKSARVRWSPNTTSSCRSKIFPLTVSSPRARTSAIWGALPSACSPTRCRSTARKRRSSTASRVRSEYSSGSDKSGAASSATRSYAGALPPTRIPRRSIEPTARFVTCRNGMKRLMSQRRMRCTCHRKSA
jgi:putative endopeptidase